MLFVLLELFIPPYNLIFFLGMIILTVSVLLILKKVFKISKEDLSSSFVSVYFLTFIIEIVAFIFSFLKVSALSLILPLINEVNSEWWPDTPHPCLAMTLFIIMFIATYFSSRLVLTLIYRKKFIDKSKAFKFTLFYLLVTSIIWFTILLVFFIIIA